MSDMLTITWFHGIQEMAQVVQQIIYENGQVSINKGKFAYPDATQSKM